MRWPLIAFKSDAYSSSLFFTIILTTRSYLHPNLPVFISSFSVEEIRNGINFASNASAGFRAPLPPRPAGATAAVVACRRKRQRHGFRAPIAVVILQLLTTGLLLLVGGVVVIIIIIIIHV
jgi:hypothetical protein